MQDKIGKAVSLLRFMKFSEIRERRLNISQQVNFSLCQNKIWKIFPDTKKVIKLHQDI